jgi:uncharacterized protein
LLLGLIDCTLLLWPGDILIIYALAGFAVLILHPLKPQWLLLIAATVLLAISGWEASEARTIIAAATVYTPRMLAIESAGRLGNYLHAVEFMGSVSWLWTVNPLTYRWVGDTGAMMLVGMALYRFGLLGDGADLRILRRMAIGGYGAGLVLRIAHIALILGHGGGPTVISALIDQPGRLAMTLGHVGLFQLLWRHGEMSRLGRRLAEMGRMALTLYLGQSLMAAFIFFGFGLGLWNRLSWPQLWLVALAMLVIEAAFAALWFKAFRFGPLEWLWRWGAYGRRP